MEYIRYNRLCRLAESIPFGCMYYNGKTDICFKYSVCVLRFYFLFFFSFYVWIPRVLCLGVVWIREIENVSQISRMWANAQANRQKKRIFAIEMANNTKFHRFRWWLRMSVVPVLHVSNEIPRFLMKCLKLLFALHVNAINTIYTSFNILHKYKQNTSRK